jgi:hypothetical protein
MWLSPSGRITRKTHVVMSFILRALGSESSVSSSFHLLTMAPKSVAEHSLQHTCRHLQLWGYMNFGVSKPFYRYHEYESQEVNRIMSRDSHRNVPAARNASTHTWMRQWDVKHNMEKETSVYMTKMKSGYPCYYFVQKLLIPNLLHRTKNTISILQRHSALR